MVTAIWVILGACMMVVVEAQVVCPADWIESPTSQTCIKVYTDFLNWYGAREACQAEGSDLVKIIDQEMDQLVRDITCENDWFFWIGLNDIIEEGTYVWLDEEEEATYVDWAEGYLSNKNEEYDCAFVFSACNTFADNYYWEDFDCTFPPLYYVCEAPSPVTTTTKMTTASTSTTIALETTRTTARTTTHPTTNNNDITAQSTTRDASHPTTTNDITAKSTTTTAHEPITNAKSSPVSTTDSVSPPATETSGTTEAISLGMGSLYTYLLLAIAAALGLILLVHTAMFLQSCYFGNRIIKKISEPATSLERRKHLVQFFNTVYDFPDGEQGTVF